MQSWHLERSRDTGRVAGVCAGVAARWAIDPVLVRVAAVLLALWGGVGLVLYAAAWALLPVRGHAEAPLFRLLPRARRVPLWAWWTVAGAAALVVLISLGSVVPIGPAVLVAIAIAYYFLVHRRRAHPDDAAQDRSSDDAAPVTPAGTADPGTADPGTAGPGRAAPGRATTSPNDAEPSGWAADLPPAVPGRSPRPTPPPPGFDPGRAAFFSHPDPAGLYDEPRPASAAAGPIPTTSVRRGDRPLARRVRRWGLIAAAIAVAVLAVLDGPVGLDVPFAAYPSIALLALGVTLVVSAWTGRPRGVLPLAVLLLLTTMAGLTGSAGSNGDLSAMSANRVYSGTSDLPEDHHDEFDFGGATVDLSGFTADRDITYRVSIDTGSLRVRLPRHMPVEVEAEMDTGSITLPNTAGVSGVDVEQRASYPAETAGPADTSDAGDLATLTVIISGDTGSIEVLR